jgi:putative drug exporter of the RND superfamily
VVAAVLVVLLVLLRRPVLSVYLIMTVVLGYLTTLGVTLLILRLTQGADFVGPDWKVPIFLFTILVAVGEDYNIFLVTRVREEEKQSGTSAGVIEAVARTGGVITSCGLIMAGTFATLFAGSLAELHQMGFALAFGVLLDTLIIRPVLVPCWIHLTRRRTPASGVTAPVADEQFMSSTRH